MLSDFENWSSSRVESTIFDDLAGSTIAIEASWFLNRFLTPGSQFQDQLHSALGGTPYGLYLQISSELDRLKHFDITPIFVFDGLDGTKKHRPLGTADHVTKIDTAWTVYDQPNKPALPIDILTAFGNLGEYS